MDFDNIKLKSHKSNEQHHHHQKSSASSAWKDIVSMNELANVPLELFKTLPETGIGVHYYPPENREHLMIPMRKSTYLLSGDSNVVAEHTDAYTGAYAYMELGKVYLVSVKRPVHMICHTPGEEGRHIVAKLEPEGLLLTVRNACNLHQSCFMTR